MALIPEYPEQTLSATADDLALLEINRIQTVSRALANTAHDLNNLLQVIGGNAELLATRAALGPNEMRRVETIAAQTGRAAAILDQLMTYNRPAPVGRQVVSLDATMSEALAMRDFSMRRAQVSVSVDRRAVDGCRAAVDRRRLLQVFLNLLMNAETALAGRRDGSALVTVTLELRGSECVVTVADNGPGFSEAALARLSEATSPALSGSASGLGLVASARIVQEFGGRIDVSNAAGSGAVVTLWMPAA